MKRQEGYNRALIIFKAELLHLLRDPISLCVALFMPIFLLFLIAYAMDLELKESAVAVYDMNKSQQSVEYIKTVDKTTYFNVRYRARNYAELLDLLDRGVVKLAIVIPPNFSEKLARGEYAEIQTLVDASYINSAMFILSYMESINSAYSANIVNNFVRLTGHAFSSQPVRLNTRSWYNQDLREFTFKITGAFCVIILGFVPLLTALAIVREKESGSLQQVFASSITSYEYIAGKMAPYVIFLTVDYFLVITFSVWFFDLPFRGSIVAIFMFTLLMVSSCVGIGFFISTIAKNQLTAGMLAIVATLMPAFIASDSIISIDNSPEIYRWYTYFFPGWSYTGICRAILLKGANIMDYIKDGLSLVVYFIVIFSICVWRIRGKNI